MPAKKIDLRRESGQRTRDQLLTAALSLLAERGPDGVTLREITDAAGVNVAAVSYHFGSLKGLCEAAGEVALERYLGAQHEAISTLPPGVGLRELASAFARPMVDALAAGGRDLAVMRTLAWFGTDPPPGWDRLDDKFAEIRADVIQLLELHLPEVDEQELIFRLRCAAGMLNWLALAPIGAELAGKPAGQIERLLWPVLAGAFHGDPGAG
jgi:AcrR family transcriptional regulator